MKNKLKESILLILPMIVIIAIIGLCSYSAVRTITKVKFTWFIIICLPFIFVACYCLVMPIINGFTDIIKSLKEIWL